MSDEQGALELSAEEQQYFEEGGEVEADVSSDALSETVEGGEQPEERLAAGEKPESQQQDRPPKGYVPQQALHQERERRKASDAELKQSREQYTRLDERLNILFEQAQPKEPEIPSVEQDPLGHFEARSKALEKTVAGLSEQIEETATQRQERAKQQSIYDEYARHAAAFKRENPDFEQAYGHFAQSLYDELEEAGYADPKSAARALEMDIAKNALESHQDPAEIVYRRAKKRGYAPKQQASQQMNADAEKLENVAKGQEQFKSLSNAGGGSKPDLTLETLAKMDDDEFMKKIEDGTFKRLMS